MPWWYRLKFHHLGSLSWALDYDPPPGYRALKEYQLADLDRRALDLERHDRTNVAR